MGQVSEVATVAMGCCLHHAGFTSVTSSLLKDDIHDAGDTKRQKESGMRAERKGYRCQPPGREDVLTTTTTTATTTTTQKLIITISTSSACVQAQQVSRCVCYGTSLEEIQKVEELIVNLCHVGEFIELFPTRPAWQPCSPPSGDLAAMPGF
ncbi:hypothetical protein E2C01_046438 [Portunus trituberculatus]|uniref:Uncharacterized protein n=1 Tax=Portunus trituberculatus TaxID=210409 RepID=A0A5B7G605_PORTR|nr:hypothetical protein [Portunus trituberculatus]